MTSTVRQRTDGDIAGIWRRFKSSQAELLGDWLEAERAVARARHDGSINGGSGDRLMAAEAALQGAIIDFAATERVSGDPTPIALGLLRLAEGELATDPSKED